MGRMPGSRADGLQQVVVLGGDVEAVDEIAAQRERPHHRQPGGVENDDQHVPAESLGQDHCRHQQDQADNERGHGDHVTVTAVQPQRARRGQQRDDERPGQPRRPRQLAPGNSYLRRRIDRCRQQARAYHFQAHQQGPGPQRRGHAGERPQQVDREAAPEKDHDRGARNVDRERGNRLAGDPERAQQQHAGDDEQHRHEQHLHGPRVPHRHQQGHQGQGGHVAPEPPAHRRGSVAREALSVPR
jgi:hypothetical protein